MLLLLLLLLLPSALTAFPVADEYCVTLFHSEELVWLNDTRAAQLWASTRCLRGRGEEQAYAIITPGEGGVPHFVSQGDAFPYRSQYYVL
jgi:hypothetical protein